jgi:putative OPT family oligopeptide transporter
MALPENAHRKLKPAEEYVPVIPDSSGFKQLSFYSIVFGFLMLIVFSGASVFLGVKIAQVPEAGMSVALFAMVFSMLIRRTKPLLENVIVQCIASVATGVACLIFVFPAVYILGLPEPSLVATLVPCAIGGVFAILFTILVRKYYVSDMHGEYPYPEATAAASTLSAGQSAGGGEVKLIGLGLLFGGVIDMANNFFGAWKGVFSTQFLPLLDKVAEKTKLVFAYDTSAAVFGMGYIIGLRYGSIICATSAIAYWLLVPFFGFFAESSWLGAFLPDSILKDGGTGEAVPFSTLPSDVVFRSLVRPIGIGTFFTAGLLSIIFEGKNIVKSIQGILGKGKLSLGGGKAGENTRDIDGRLVLAMFGLTLVAVAAFLFEIFGGRWDTTLILLVATVALMIVFLPAAIMATITTGNAPVSGMTIVCLVASCLLLSALGFTGPHGQLVATMLGSFMVVTLAFGSSFITDLKIGYWLGSTPAKQEWMKIVGVVVSSVVVVLSMYVVNEQFGFVASAEHPNPMPAPQANAMADIIKTFMGGGAAAWWLYGLGAVVAMLMRLVFKIPAIVVALGLYIPMEYNMPILGGALVGHYLSKMRAGESSDAAAKDRYDRGMMVATGLIAAGSVAGILSAVLKYFGLDLGEDFKLMLPCDYDWSIWLSLAVVVISIIFLYRISGKRYNTAH